MLDHLKKLKMVSRLDVWVPHQLNEKNLLDRYNACTTLLNRFQNEPFLNRILTGDEKWVIYNNVVRKRHWATKKEVPLTVAKPNLHQNKVLLCCWWDSRGVVYYELLKPGETITSVRYCQQLNKLNEALRIKRPDLVNRKGIIFHQDNARPHVAMMTQKKLCEFGWEIMSHPPYSPDIAPSDYYLFLSLQNYLSGKKCNFFEEAQTCIADFFNSKPPSFFKEGIYKLPDRWRKVIANNGNYYID